VVCGLSGCNIFSHIITLKTRFSEKNFPKIELEFRYFLQIFVEIFLIIRGI
jgi:predicted nucleic acid-binding Zn finger protein